MEDTDKKKKQEEYIINFINQCLAENPEFTGKIEINFFNGGVGNINKTQSFKPIFKRALVLFKK